MRVSSEDPATLLGVSIGALTVRGFRQLEDGTALLCKCECGKVEEFTADEATRKQACRACCKKRRDSLKPARRQFTVSAAVKAGLEKARAARVAKREAAKAAAKEAKAQEPDGEG